MTPKVVGSAWMPWLRPIVTRVLVLEGAALQRGQQPVEIGEQDVARPRQLHAEAGVEHVGRGHALVDEARIRPDEFGKMRQEGDHVVLGHAFDLVDLRLSNVGGVALFPDGAGGLYRNDADFGQRVAGMRLDLEPDAEACLWRPDGDHLGPRIAWDHDGFIRLRDARASLPEPGAIAQRGWRANHRERAASPAKPSGK